MSEYECSLIISAPENFLAERHQTKSVSKRNHIQLLWRKRRKLKYRHKGYRSWTGKCSTPYF